MRFLTFLLLWTLFCGLWAWLVVCRLRRHEKVYLLLVLDAFYLLGVFWGYHLIEGVP